MYALWKDLGFGDGSHTLTRLVMIGLGVCVCVCVCSEVGAIEAQIREAKARKKRAAIPVIGDMSALMDSLPTFDLLLDRATVQSRLHRQSVFIGCHLHIIQYNTTTTTTTVCPGLPGWAGTRKVKPIWIYWSKRWWVAVVSAGPYANLYLTQTDSHASTSLLSFLQAGCLSCYPTNSIKALKAWKRSFKNITFNVYSIVGHIFWTLYVAIAAYVSTQHGLSVRYVDHALDPCKNVSTDWDAIGIDLQAHGPKEPLLARLDMGATWRIRLNHQIWLQCWLSLPLVSCL